MEKKKYYLMFSVDRIPDLTLIKYSAMESSSVSELMGKHAVFLRQLHRLGSISQVYFHLLYYFDANPAIPKGKHLSVLFYATSPVRERLEGIREFLTSSVLSPYYDFHCCVTTAEKPREDTVLLGNGQQVNVVYAHSVTGQEQRYGIRNTETYALRAAQRDFDQGRRQALSLEIASDADAVLSVARWQVRPDGQMIFPRRFCMAERGEMVTNADGKDEIILTFADGIRKSFIPCFDRKGEKADVLRKGLFARSGETLVFFFEPDGNRVEDFWSKSIPYDSSGVPVLPLDIMERRFTHMAYLTKKDYYLPAQNWLEGDTGNGVRLYSVLEWKPSDTGRLYNVLKLMEGYGRTVALRVDIYPEEKTLDIRERLPYADVRKRISSRDQGKDDNSEFIVRSWDSYLQNLMKFPQYNANVVALADASDIAVMLADSVAAETVESGSYEVERLEDPDGMNVYAGDDEPIHLTRLYSEGTDEDQKNIIKQILSLYTLAELRPMFSFPILYPGESIECLKETDPHGFPTSAGETINLGRSALGYPVDFPISLFAKHAFVAGVPGAGKTNTMLHLATSLWKYAQKPIPFLVLEPAKQEYRALAKIDGMEELRIFSPGADTFFPLHINPFQFPVGLTLAEHIANLNAVFAGAFFLPPPSPHFIDSCIEKVYLDKGWNVNERNILDEHGEYRHPFPTMQNLYDSLKEAVENSHYEGETRGNLQAVLEVRVGSLLKREVGNVYNVRESILRPEEWLDVPAVIELEALGEGPANFMSLLLSTLIRETLKVRKTKDADVSGQESGLLNHVIFYEEAHNLIGPNTDDPNGDTVDPKVSATKYLVKMLAEVRALREGIVIADQLPTVMAPEVLKNTGLKIAHRITAQDDRSLLGGTMSASADQLEEQGTFGTGWALIFYEGLLKPYKMRVSEWEVQNRDQGKYESPSNQVLHQLLMVQNPTYQETLKKSAKILREKVDEEFEVLLRKKNETARILEREKRDFNWQEESLAVKKMKFKAPAGSDRELSYSLEEQKLAHRGEQILSSRRRRITNLCIEAKNSFYAAITLSENYQNITQGIRVGAIDGFLTFLEEMRPLAKDDGLGDILWEETQDVFAVLHPLLSLLPWNGGKDLVPDGITERLIIKCRSYLLLNAEKMGRQLANRALELCNREVDEEEIGNFCLQMEQEFRDAIQLADVYRRAFLLVQRDATKGDNSFVDSLWKLRPLAITEEDEFILHKSALLMVLQALMELKELPGAGAWAFMLHSKALRDELLAMVNWQFETAEALLHSCQDYSLLREKLGIMELFSLRAYIYHLESIYHCSFLGTATPCPELLAAADDRANPDYSHSWDVLESLSRDVYEAYERYRVLDVQNREFQKTLVDFFYGYMELLICFDLRENKGLDFIRGIPKLWACRIHSHTMARELRTLQGNDALPTAMEKKWNRVEKQENLSLKSNWVEEKSSSQ